MKKKLIIIGAIVLVLGAAGYYYFFVYSTKAAPLEWRTVKVDQGDLKVVVTATGQLSAVTTVQVGTQVSGTISKINVDFNSIVRKGDVVAVIDTTFLGSSLRDAEAGLIKAQVAVRQAKRDLDRVKQLFDKKLSAQADLDNATTTYESGVAALTSAQAQVDRARINLNYATIRAPISGVVISRAVDVGQTVAASFSTPTLFTIAQDLTKMQVQASVDEADIGKIRQEQHVTFTVDAYPNRTFDGEIGQVRLQPVISNNVVNYTVVVNVPNEDLKLMPGMTANITVGIEERTAVLKVATGALRFTPPREYFQEMAAQLPDSVKAKWREGGGGRGEGQGRGEGRPQGMGQGQGQPGGGKQSELAPGSMARVWIKDGAKLKPVRVKIGLSDGTFTEISGEITQGTDVVIGVINQNNAAPTQQQQSPFQGMRRF